VRKVKELESELGVLRDRVDEVDVWVQKSSQQVGSDAVAVEGIQDSVGFSITHFVDYYSNGISEDEFAEQLHKLKQ